MFHPDLQKLLDYALQDGDISAKERDLLHKKANELGEDIDMLEMVIEGELQKLQKQNVPEKQTTFSCPSCGASIPKSSIKCAFCDFEISKKNVTGAESISLLSQKLEQIDIVDSDVEKNSHSFRNPYNPLNAARKKATAISTFNMPNDKEHLLEFFLFCDSNADSYSDTSIYGNASSQTNKILNPAWSGKAKLGYNKLKRFANEDDEIKILIDEYKIKYQIEAKDMKQSPINKPQNQDNGKAVLFGLNQNGVMLGIVLLLFCFPLCWIPFVIPQFKGE